MAVRNDPDRMIDYLNSLVELDRKAISELVKSHVVCNSELTDHESVQVATVAGGFTVGMLGILNGYFGTIDEPGDHYGYGPITVVLDLDGVCRFERTAELKECKI